ncbi:glycosyltransferase [Candidatus Daviesbacteria bacterium]|nr:glycosyltransferase [Candidatus Daviesbacteria bacterium]
MKVALVHDYLWEFGGAERVLEALHEIFPQAPIFTAYYNLDKLGPHKNRIKNWDLRSSWLQNFPFASKFISPSRIFAKKIFESFDLSSFDVVISSCNTYFAKAVLTKPSQLHISYIHTPPRYLYGYTTSFNYKKHMLTRIGGEILNHFLRIWDFEVSQRPSILVANSKNVQERIKKFYRRDSLVIYPPVDISSFPRKRESNRSPIRTLATLKTLQPSVVKSGMTDKGEYFLSLGRLVRGKGTEIAVAAATKLNLPLKVAGVGPQMDELKAFAGKNVEFLGEVTDEERVSLLSNAKALIVSSEDEDFGITVVEAFASGTPVIAVKAGGYLETMINGKTGEFFKEAKVEELVKVLEKFDQDKYSSSFLRKHAEKFSKNKFKKEVLELVNENIKS